MQMFHFNFFLSSTKYQISCETFLFTNFNWFGKYYLFMCQNVTDNTKVLYKEFLDTITKSRYIKTCGKETHVQKHTLVPKLASGLTWYLWFNVWEQTVHLFQACSSSHFQMKILLKTLWDIYIFSVWEEVPDLQWTIQ